MPDETETLPEPTADLFMSVVYEASGKQMTVTAEEWWGAWAEGRAQNFKDHWKSSGQALLDKMKQEGPALAAFVGKHSHCRPHHLKRWEDLLTAQGWQPDGSFRPTPFCIAKPKPPSPAGRPEDAKKAWQILILILGSLIGSAVTAAWAFLR